MGTREPPANPWGLWALVVKTASIQIYTVKIETSRRKPKIGDLITWMWVDDVLFTIQLNYICTAPFTIVLSHGAVQLGAPVGARRNSLF